MRNQRKRHKRKSRAPLFIILAAALLLTAAVLVFFLGNGEESREAFASSHIDERIVKLFKPVFKKDKNEEGSFSYEINKELKVKEGRARIDLVNPYENTYLMYIEIAKEDGTVILRSDLIPPGYKIKYVTFDESLPVGNYSCSASICAVDENEEFIGFLEEEINLSVK